jgi:hypothetical protein
MVPCSKNYNDQICDIDPVELIAVYLAGKFAKRLFDSYKENRYPVYVKCLAEILNWSREFYNLYYYNENNGRSFENIKDTIYDNCVHRDNFLLAWGDKRAKQFFAQKTNETEHSQQYSNNGKGGQRFPVGIEKDTDGKKIVIDGKKTDLYVGVVSTLLF